MVFNKFSLIVDVEGETPQQILRDQNFSVGQWTFDLNHKKSKLLLKKSKKNSVLELIRFNSGLKSNI